MGDVVYITPTAFSFKNFLAGSTWRQWYSRVSVGSMPTPMNTCFPSVGMNMFYCPLFRKWATLAEKVNKHRVRRGEQQLYLCHCMQFQVSEQNLHLDGSSNTWPPCRQQAFPQWIERLPAQKYRPLELLSWPFHITLAFPHLGFYYHDLTLATCIVSAFDQPT